MPTPGQLLSPSRTYGRTGRASPLLGASRYILCSLLDGDAYGIDGQRAGPARHGMGLCQAWPDAIRLAWHVVPYGPCLSGMQA
jgi:hypothetical protein